jgi:peptidoglycan/LPS O-acetylase OafA/YrhL
MAYYPTTVQAPRANNLDSLRLILALLVVLEHSNNLFHVALGDPARFPFFLMNLSDVAVSTFFIISGMLTYVSFARDPDVVRFYLRRFFRVFPAYWSIVILQIAVFCLFATALVNWGQLPAYALFNALTANFLAPTFLEGIPAINGSLWTIKIEASYYLLLPAMFPLLVRSRWLVIISVLSFLWATGLAHETLAKQLPGKLYLFAIGVALARVTANITARHSIIAMLLVPFGLALKFIVADVGVASELAEAVLGVCLVVGFMRQWVKSEPTDISYTLYLVHYPVLIFVTRILFPEQPFWLVLGAGLVLSVTLAIAFSRLVERPALAFGRKLVSRSGKPRPFVSSTQSAKT